MIWPKIPKGILHKMIYHKNLVLTRVGIRVLGGRVLPKVGGNVLSSVGGSVPKIGARVGLSVITVGISVPMTGDLVGASVSTVGGYEGDNVGSNVVGSNVPIIGAFVGIVVGSGSTINNSLVHVNSLNCPRTASPSSFFIK